MRRRGDRDAGKPGTGVAVKRTFNGRVIFVYEMALNELDSQARFTDTTATDDNQLVFS